jgi:hypothetical protein
LPEGLSATEVGKEIAEHKEHDAAHGEKEVEGEWRDHRISILEAVILSFVAVLAAYSGYAAAKWGTESSLSLARASALRTKASRADLEAMVTRTQDSATFNAWFTAFVAGNVTAERIAERRLRPGYRVAFKAWLATDPAHNPNSPPGPAYMPQYVIPQQATGNNDEAEADKASAEGQDAGGTSDKYIRDTVFLATVLFLVGISGHFRIRQARYALVGFSLVLLAFSIVQLAGLPAPP